MEVKMMEEREREKEEGKQKKGQKKDEVGLKHD